MLGKHSRACFGAEVKSTEASKPASIPTFGRIGRSRRTRDVATTDSQLVPRTIGGLLNAHETISIASHSRPLWNPAVIRTNNLLNDAAR
jgi:hypothetical protein